MKFAIAFLAITMALNVSAKSLSCTAELSSKAQDLEKFIQALDWMKKNKVDDEALVPKELHPKPVKIETRALELDENGDANLSGIIIDAYEEFGISYNFSASAQKGFITHIGAENEVVHNGSGVANLKNQTEVEYSSGSLDDGSDLTVRCEIK